MSIIKVGFDKWYSLVFFFVYGRNDNHDNFDNDDTDDDEDQKRKKLLDCEHLQIAAMIPIATIKGTNNFHSYWSK